MNIIDKMYDIIDECCMKLNEKIKLNYFDSLIRVCNDILYEIDDSKLDEEDLKFLESKYEQLQNVSINSEEVRKVMQLLIIKAMKHINMSLDLMTPDYINYLFGYLVNSFYQYEKKIKILDVEVGTGNLISSINNFVNFELELIGVENNKMLVDVCKAMCDMQGENISIYFQDVLTRFTEKVNVIVGDLDCYEKDDKYYPYEIILNYKDNLYEDGIFIYLVENDFFNKKGVEEFKKEFDGTLLGLIVLPDELFQNGHVGKSILVGTYKQLKDFSMMIMKLSSLNDKDKFLNNLQEIQKWINNTKERII